MKDPKWLAELNEKLNDLNASSKYQFTHGKKAVCPAGRWWFGCLDTLPETLRSRLGVTSEAGTLGDAYLGYVGTQAVKESASETPGNRVWYFALTSVSEDDDEEFPLLISRFTGNLSDVGEVKNWFVGLPLDKLPKQWNTFSEFETFGKVEDVKHDFYPECSGSLISGDRAVEGRLPECFSLKKVYWGDTLKTWTGEPDFSDSDYDSEATRHLVADHFVGDPVMFFTALFDAFIQFENGFRDDTSLSCDTTLFRTVADIERKLNKILDENETSFPKIPIRVAVDINDDMCEEFLVVLYKERKVAVPDGELKWASFEHDGEPGTVNCLFTSGLFADIKTKPIDDFVWSFYDAEPFQQETLPDNPSWTTNPVCVYAKQSLKTLGYFTQNRYPIEGSVNFVDEGRFTLRNDDVPPKIMDAQEHLNHYRKYARTSSASDININNIVDVCEIYGMNISDRYEVAEFILGSWELLDNNDDEDSDDSSEESDSEEDLANRQTWTPQRQFNPDTDNLGDFIFESYQQQPNSDPRRNSSLEVGNNDSSEDSDSEEDLANLPSRYTY